MFNPFQSTDPQTKIKLKKLKIFAQIEKDFRYMVFDLAGSYETADSATELITKTFNSPNCNYLEKIKDILDRI